MTYTWEQTVPNHIYVPTVFFFVFKIKVSMISNGFEKGAIPIWFGFYCETLKNGQIRPKTILRSAAPQKASSYGLVHSVYVF